MHELTKVMGLDPMGPALFWTAVLDASGVLSNLRFPPRKPDSAGEEVRSVIGGEGPAVMGRLGPPPNGGGREVTPGGFPFCTPEESCSGPK